MGSPTDWRSFLLTLRSVGTSGSPALCAAAWTRDPTPRSRAASPLASTPQESGRIFPAGDKPPSRFIGAVARGAPLRGPAPGGAEGGEVWPRN